MPKGKPVSTNTRRQIWELHKLDVPRKEIAVQTGVAYNTVCNIIIEKFDSWHNTNHVGRIPKKRNELQRPRPPGNRDVTELKEELELYKQVNEEQRGEIEMKAQHISALKIGQKNLTSQRDSLSERLKEELLSNEKLRNELESAKNVTHETMHVISPTVIARNFEDQDPEYIIADLQNLMCANETGTLNVTKGIKYYTVTMSIKLPIVEE